MRVLDLFSGIGGFSLGLERAGMRTVAFCEIDPYARAVLRKHWPDVPCYDDVRDLTADRLAADGIGPIETICGGFPCQDLSFAGKGAGLAGERSGLWSEIARLVGELRPRYVIVENVSALLGRGLERVLGDLAEIGYDAEWHCIPASAVGAPHRRDRVWIVSYPNGQPDERGRGEFSAAQGPETRRSGHGPGRVGEIMAHADEPRLERWIREGLRECTGKRTSWPSGSPAENTAGERLEGRACAGDEKQSSPGRLLSSRSGELRGGEVWRTEPDVGRVAHGVPARVDRLRCLGNAVVPAIPEILGRAILEAERMK